MVTVSCFVALRAQFAERVHSGAKTKALYLLGHEVDEVKVQFNFNKKNLQFLTLDCQTLELRWFTSVQLWANSVVSFGRKS